jgi:ABC-type nitrate/sulfonate/bicarbonate transport system substrate-binding protein
MLRLQDVPMRAAKRCAALLATAFLTTGPDALPAHAAKVLFGQVSPTATGWPGIIAQRKGFFAANGIEIETSLIGVSEGMLAVSSGSLNVMHNTCNAVVNFIERGGDTVRLAMVTMNGHPALLVGKKGISGIAELHGKTVGTSSVRSGSTILLRRLLRTHGLGDADYNLIGGGGSAQMYTGLQGGAYDAVWLVPPQSNAAAVAGFPVLGAFRDVAPKFLFVCFAVNRGWLAANTDLARRFAKAWLAGIAWLHDPANQAEAQKCLAEELKLAPEVAASTYDELVVRNSETYPRDGKVNFEALRAVIEIMVEGAELTAPPHGDIRKYVDETMLDTTN